MFYPGGIWSRRISSLLVICTIGVNLFMNEVQNILFETSIAVIEQTRALAKPAGNVANVIESNIVPAVKYIEESQVGGIAKRYGLPSSMSLQENANQIYLLQETLEFYAPLIRPICEILWILNIGFFISTILATCWIYNDIKKSKAWIVDIPILIFAIWFNFMSYKYLTSLLEF